MTRGYIKIPRSFFELGIWKQPRTFSRNEAVFDLLRRANFHDSAITTKQGVKRVEKDQVVCDASGLAKDWGWTIDNVKTFIRQLQDLEILSIACNEPPCILTMHPERPQPRSP
jgi:hypothetical protein